MMCHVCRRCVVVFLITNEEQTSLLVDVLQRGLVCPRCEEPLEDVLLSEISPEALSYFSRVELTAEEFLRAGMGLGLPEERECTKRQVEVLLREFPIRRINGHDIPNTNRMVLESLELWDGTVLHFGSSGYGATIYRVVRPVDSTKKVLDELK